MHLVVLQQVRRELGAAVLHCCIAALLLSESLALEQERSQGCLGVGLVPRAAL